MTTPDRRQHVSVALACPMPQPNDADAATVRDYLVTLLATLWRKEADFYGERPFGKSGWSLAHAGRVTRAARRILPAPCGMIYGVGVSSVQTG